MFLAISAELSDVIHQRGTGQQHPLGEEGRLSCEVQLQWIETVRGFGLGIQRFPVRRQGVLRLCWLLVLGAGGRPALPCLGMLGKRMRARVWRYWRC